jgi:glycosyltransferase involved in cell wall biosynthesis
MFPSNPAIPRKGYPLAKAAVDYAAKQTRKPVELITLWGIPPTDVALHMNACDAMLMTSFLEGSPNVVKEALACNLPVVSVPVGDVSELLAEVAGCAQCPRDPALLGAALAQILTRGHRATGRSHLQRRGLDLASVARRIKAIYETVLDQRRGQASIPRAICPAHSHPPRLDTDPSSAQPSRRRSGAGK